MDRRSFLAGMAAAPVAGAMTGVAAIAQGNSGSITLPATGSKIGSIGEPTIQWKSTGNEPLCLGLAWQRYPAIMAKQHILKHTPACMWWLDRSRFYDHSNWERRIAAGVRVAEFAFSRQFEFAVKKEFASICDLFSINPDRVWESFWKIPEQDRFLPELIAIHRSTGTLIAPAHTFVNRLFEQGEFDHPFGRPYESGSPVSFSVYVSNNPKEGLGDLMDSELVLGLKAEFHPQIREFLVHYLGMHLDIVGYSIDPWKITR